MGWGEALKGVPCLGRSSQRHKAGLRLRELSALLAGGGRLLLLGVHFIVNETKKVVFLDTGVFF